MIWFKCQNFRRSIDSSRLFVVLIKTKYLYIAFQIQHSRKWPSTKYLLPDAGFDVNVSEGVYLSKKGYKGAPSSRFKVPISASNQFWLFVWGGGVEKFGFPLF